jgi:hypothetical protein
MKLSKLILNTNDIQKIVIQPNKYYIHIAHRKIDGFGWSSGGFGIGTISSHTSEIELCKTKDSIDYKIVFDWISKIE